MAFITSSSLNYIFKNNLDLVICVNLGLTSKTHYDLLLGDESFWKRWIPADRASNKTLAQLKEEVIYEYCNKHQFDSFRISLTTFNFPTIAQKMGKIVKLLRSYPGLIEKHLSLLRMCVFLGANCRGSSPLEVASIEILELLSTSKTFDCGDLQHFQCRIEKMGTQSSKFKNNLKTLQALEDEKRSD